MEPAIPVGSLIVVTSEQSYTTGDVVTFYDELGQIPTTHRITAITGESVATKGDANEEADIETIELNRIAGKVMFSVPYLGFPVLLSQTKQGSILFIIIPTVGLILFEFISILKELQNMFKGGKRHKAKSQESKNPEQASTG